MIRGVAMHYSPEELILYLFIYAFMGWCVEVAVMALRTGRFCNRGFLNLPLCLSYGITMDIFIVFLPPTPGHWLFAGAAYVTVASVAAYLSGAISKLLLGVRLWQFQSLSIFAGGKRNLLYALTLGCLGLLTHQLLHPLIYMLGTLIPDMLLRVIAITGCVLLLWDALTVILTIRTGQGKSSPRGVMADIRRRKSRLGQRVSDGIQNRLEKAYPEICVEDTGSHSRFTFAQGLCMDKLIWVFMICALLGDLIETVFVGLQTGRIMSRSSVIYGPFSIVWGAGGVLLTILLQKIAKKDDRYAFIAGFVIGGVYEYMCSAFTELVLGTTFWDYSNEPFNIGGRTHLTFCLYWGILALVWVKFLYPFLSRQIEKIPPIAGKILTWIMVVFMTCNALLSGVSVLRYVERREGTSPGSAIEVFLDTHYDDALIETIYPNMRIDAQLVAEKD